MVLYTQCGYSGKHLFVLVSAAIPVTSLLISGNYTSSFSIGIVIAKPYLETDLRGMNPTLTDSDVCLLVSESSLQFAIVLIKSFTVHQKEILNDGGIYHETQH